MKEKVCIEFTNEDDNTIGLQEGAELSGTLYLCATPIGNLEDITLRVLRILREVDLIAAEDTRHTRQLLTHYDIHQNLTSYHEHNRMSKAPELLAKLQAGKDIALVTDAGLPGISDPGSDLVRQALEQGLPVEVLPGASAGISALTISGLNTERFVFEAFLLRRSKKEYKERLKELARERRTVIFYEAPHRLLTTLQDLTEACGGSRKAVVARELTKKYEELRRDTLEGLLSYYKEHPPRGEITVLLSGASDEEILAAAEADLSAEEAARFKLPLAEQVSLLISEGMDKKQAIRQVAERCGLPKREVYNQVMRSQDQRDK